MRRATTQPAFLTRPRSEGAEMSELPLASQAWYVFARRTRVRARRASRTQTKCRWHFVPSKRNATGISFLASGQAMDGLPGLQAKQGLRSVAGTRRYVEHPKTAMPCSTRRI